MEAKLISKHKDGYTVELTYEYRGFRYVISVRPGSGDSIKYQHQFEQHRIDDYIANENKGGNHNPIDWDEIFSLLEEE